MKNGDLLMKLVGIGECEGAKLISFNNRGTSISVDQKLNELDTIVYDIKGIIKDQMEILKNLKENLGVYENQIGNINIHIGNIMVDISSISQQILLLDGLSPDCIKNLCKNYKKK